MSTNSTTTTTPTRAQALAERAFAALERFLHIEAVGGAVLMLAAACALIWANSSQGSAYQALWHAPLSLGLGPHEVALPLHFWINDGLMTLFFLVVGLEIRREMHEGALASLKLATLPIVAAIGGVALPAALYVALVGLPGTLQGWAVPAATDIAFAVGVLALLGRSVHANVRVLLLALAIIDDIVAVLIIALFYTAKLDLASLWWVAAAVAAAAGLRALGIRRAWVYVLPGALLWWGLLKTGIHPTLAGVVLGLMAPVTVLKPWERQPPVQRVQAALHPWVAYGVMPLFALANAGVELGGASTSGAATEIASAVAIALAVGKPLGVLLACGLCVRLRWCELPPGVTMPGVLLVGLLAGIGFTMAIFIAGLAFAADAALLDAAKRGVLAGSAASAVLGLAWGAALALRSRGAAGR